MLNATRAATTAKRFPLYRYKYIDKSPFYRYICFILLIVRDVTGDVDLTERERFLNGRGSSLLLSGGLGIDPPGA
jgi:hypothetical protein